MSDLSATNCGCGCESGMGRSGGECGFGNNSCLWIILLLFCCGGCGSTFGGGCGNDSCLWIILLLLFCGGGCGSGCGGFDCGC